jgi:phosphoenolpyruvate carboxykinase (GTP)
MASETTAAATGAVGVSRRDPMAMIPFCGYNMADYFQHWLDMGPKIKNAPKIFHVNWFRKDSNGKFLWPGFGENVRVLKWIADRIEGRAAATDTPIGFVPTPSSLTLDGMNISRESLDELLSVNSSDWAQETEATAKFFEIFGDRLPQEITNQQKALSDRLARTTVAAK